MQMGLFNFLQKKGKTVEYDAEGIVLSINVKQGSWAKQVNSGSTYYSQKSAGLLAASEILKQLQSVPPNTYYLVDTPDGTLGRDMNGFFTEAPIKTEGLHVECPAHAKTEPVEPQSLTQYGNVIANQSGAAMLKKSGQYAKLVLMMKCGHCGYESPVETVEGDMVRQCYCCGTKNKTHRGKITVYTQFGNVEI